LTADEFRSAVRDVGLVIAGQSANLAPADKQLYGLRDVTGTVESIPLIAASVMSKKLAAGADCIVLDVKVGRGAFMKTVEDARALAGRMVAIGQRAGRKVSAVITSMEQPLGTSIGNALEVKEAIATLRGHGPSDFIDLCVALGAQLVMLAGKAPDARGAEQQLRSALESGAAWEKFRAFIAYQGGDVATIDDPTLLPEATVVEPVFAPRDGFVTSIDALELGIVVNDLGGGRQRKGDAIDPSVGIVLERKVGEFVAHGAPLATIHASHGEQIERVRQRVQAAFSIESQQQPVPPLIFEVVT
jgi:pyrimidine-nucleoside phosphorylase